VQRSTAQSDSLMVTSETSDRTGPKKTGVKLQISAGPVMPGHRLSELPMSSRQFSA